jgi:hypothetical protein
MAGVQRGVGGGVRRPLANGGARAVRCGQCAGVAWLGRGPVDVAHRDLGARRSNHWTQAGLGVRVQRRMTVGSTWPGATLSARCERGPAPKLFGVALFQREILQIFQLKCTKG